MKSDFLLAITQLSAEKNLPREVVLATVEAALVSAYRKDNFVQNQNITVKINPNNGKIEVWAEKQVVEQPEDPRREISVSEARRLKSDAQLGEAIMVESTPQNAGRIAAQTAKQVILQRLHEAEHSAIIEEFTEKEGSIVTGVVQRIEPNKQIFIDLGRTEALLPVAEQVHSEKYRIGQRLKVYLLEVAKTNKGPRVIVSRSHPNLLRRLFELEIPEVFSGAVELKSIAREAGFRSKVAVTRHQEGIDPVGCCVGLRGIRIQNIVNELNGEKIDVVLWDPSPAIFIANALSPAQVIAVTLNEGEKVAKVVIPDKQLSLAIGKEGQNVRLAVKLTEWRIDIKSASVADTGHCSRQGERRRRGEGNSRRRKCKEGGGTPAG
jgi:N utilization substance protein A